MRYTTHANIQHNHTGVLHRRGHRICTATAAVLLTASTSILTPTPLLASPTQQVPAPAAQTATTNNDHAITKGTINWGVMPTLREYASNPYVSAVLDLTDVTHNDKGEFIWKNGTGSYTNGSGTIMIPGVLSLRSNHSQLNMRFSRVRITISDSGASGKITLDATISTLDGQRKTYTNVDFATINTENLKVADGRISLNKAPLTMTDDGARIFDGTQLLPQNRELDPITLNASLTHPTFSDVPAGSHLQPEIEWLAASGITTGYPNGTYHPHESVERAAVAAYFYRLAGSPAVTLPQESPFIDVPTDHPFYKEIVWLHRRGITTGYPDGTFRPNAPINRDALAAFFYRAAQEPDYTPPATSPFTDMAPHDGFYKEIAWMHSQNIAHGWPDRTFRPLQPVQRDAMAAFIYRMVR